MSSPCAPSTGRWLGPTSPGVLSLVGFQDCLTVALLGLTGEGAVWDIWGPGSWLVVCVEMGSGCMRTTAGQQQAADWCQVQGAPDLKFSDASLEPKQSGTAW